MAEKEEYTTADIIAIVKEIKKEILYKFEVKEWIHPRLVGDERQKRFRIYSQNDLKNIQAAWAYIKKGLTYDKAWDIVLHKGEDKMLNAFLQIKTKGRDKARLLDWVASLPTICFNIVTLGPCDLMALVDYGHPTDLEELVFGKIKRDEGVEATTTYIIAKKDLYLAKSSQTSGRFVKDVLNILNRVDPMSPEIISFVHTLGDTAKLQRIVKKHDIVKLFTPVFGVWDGIILVVAPSQYELGRFVEKHLLESGVVERTETSVVLKSYMRLNPLNETDMNYSERK